MKSDKILERWKTIPDFPDYEASTFGRIRSFKVKVGRKGGGYDWIVTNTPQKILNPNISNRYPYVILYKENKGYTRSVHRLILETFIGPCPKRCEARHKDSNRTNPILKNLCWGTKQENYQDRIDNGTENKREKNPKAKLTDEKVREIKVKLKLGFTQAELGKEYNVTYQAISAIHRGKNWAHI